MCIGVRDEEGGGTKVEEKVGQQYEKNPPTGKNGGFVNAKG